MEQALLPLVAERLEPEILPDRLARYLVRVQSFSKPASVVLAKPEAEEHLPVPSSTRLTVTQLESREPVEERKEEVLIVAELPSMSSP